jgi:hypothetical protein
MKYIYHHLGLGDHIICNGLSRHFQKVYDNISIFCKPHNFENVEYMYRDNDNIKILNIGEDKDVEKFIKEKNIQKDVIRVGFEFMTGGQTFDESFYVGKSLPFSMRYDEFYLERDYELEKKIVEDLNPQKEKYIFTHNVDLNKVRKDIKIIENPKKYNIFNLITLIENAEEVHLMESSIKCLVNSYKMDNPTFYYHQYVRNYSPYLNSVGLNKFKIIY